MTSELTIDNISPDAFDEALQKYISWAAEWDGALPADTFFGVWADLQREKKPLALKARVVEGRVELSAPPHSAVKVVNNRIYLESGLELVIDLEPTT